jgi:hypothetical protein
MDLTWIKSSSKCAIFPVFGRLVSDHRRTLFHHVFAQPTTSKHEIQPFHPMFHALPSRCFFEFDFWTGPGKPCSSCDALGQWPGAILQIKPKNKVARQAQGAPASPRPIRCKQNTTACPLKSSFSSPWRLYPNRYRRRAIRRV